MFAKQIIKARMKNEAPFLHGSSHTVTLQESRLEGGRLLIQATEVTQAEVTPHSGDGDFVYSFVI